jgi:ubiquinone/menaquinone biosynthesis C-methylase UbiE
MYLETADIETASEDYAARFAGQVGEFFLARQTAITLELLRDLPGARVLDVGGGHAQLAAPMVQQGFRVTVTGSDDICRARLDRFLPAGSFAYQTCDCLALPFADRSFDVVMAFRLLPHAERWQQLLAEMCRVAGRCVVVDYPDRRSSNVLYQLLFAAKKRMEGNTRTFTLFSRSEIATELARHGFPAPTFRPEFFLPMVLHRKLGHRGLSTLLEGGSRLCGLTRVFGSPIIVRADREAGAGRRA